MKRWSDLEGKYIESENVDKFLEDVIDVCKKHGLSISHEDQHGGFEVEAISDVNLNWLMGASDKT